MKKHKNQVWGTKFESLYSGHLFIADTFLGPDGVRHREVSLYSIS